MRQSVMTTPLPKQAHELIKDPVLGDLAGATNAVVCDLYMVQAPGEDRAAWLRRMVRDADAVAQAARSLLEVESITAQKRIDAEFAREGCCTRDDSCPDHTQVAP